MKVDGVQFTSQDDMRRQLVIFAFESQWEDAITDPDVNAQVMKNGNCLSSKAQTQKDCGISNRVGSCKQVFLTARERQRQKAGRAHGRVQPECQELQYEGREGSPLPL